MAATGELYEIRGELEIEWRIKKFSTLANNENIICQSISFHFAGEIWKMKLIRQFAEDIQYLGFSRGIEYITVEYLNFELMRMSSGLPVNLEFSVGIKKVVKGDRYYSYTFKENGSYTIGKYVERSELKGKEVLPSDILTLTCTLKNKEPNDLTNSSIKRLLSLTDNFKQLYREKKDADLKLKVKGEEFLVHRMVLAARSTLAERDLKEQRIGEMNIGDINPNSMRAILDYMYTGDTNQLTKENVLFTFVAADKYGMEQLKYICCAYVKQNLSVDWVCDVIKFAIEQHAEEMDQCATKYFIEHAAKIIGTDRWKTFFRENRDKGIELYESSILKNDNNSNNHSDEDNFNTRTAIEVILAGKK